MRSIESVVMAQSRHDRYSLAALLLSAGLLGGCSGVPTSPPASEVTAPEGMVYVQAGEFLTGSKDFEADPDVGALRTVAIGAFFIDRTEVSNAEVKKVWPEHSIFPGQEEMPATELSWNQTVDILARMGKRLPTSLEWEKAARGTDGRTFPWGNDADFEGRAHVGTPKEHTSCAWGDLVAVTSNPKGASPYGLLNTVGNAFEWVADPPTEQRPYHIIRGGAFGYPPLNNRLDTVTYEQPGAT